MKFNFKIYLTIFVLLNTSTSISAAEFIGSFSQGSFILGKTSPKSKITVDNKKVRISKEGFFVFGLDRDRKNDVIIKIVKNGEVETIKKKS